MKSTLTPPKGYYPCKGLLPFFCKVLFPLLLIISNSAIGQELAFKKYGEKDGLPGTVIYQCIQDRKGFIWFATNRGVSRFNGKDFKNFTNEDGLPDNEIVKLYEDKYGNIWFVSFLGIPSVYYNDTIHKIDCQQNFFVVEDFVKDSLILINRRTIDVRKGTHIVGYYKSLGGNGNWKFTQEKSYFSKAPLKFPILRASTTTGMRFYFSDISVDTLGLQIKIKERSKSYRVTKNSKFTAYNPYSFVEVAKNKKGILFYTNDTLYYADQDKLKPLISLKSKGLNRDSDNDISYMFCENDSVLWLCTKNKGVIRMVNFMHETRTMQYFLSERYCSSILKDREGGYWITTLDDGVYYVPNIYSYRLSDSNAKITGSALCVEKLTPQRLAAGFVNGTILTINTHNLSCNEFPQWAIENKNNRILDIVSFSETKLVIASDHGLYILSTNGDYYNVNQTQGIKGAYIENDSTIAAACAARLLRVNPRTQIWKSVYDARVTCVAGLSKNYYWGTLNGAYALLNDSLVALKNTYPSLNGIINHIDVAPDSALWFSTRNGLTVLKNNVVQVIDKRRGLLSNYSNHTQFEGHTAWISTDQGISKIEYQWNKEGLSFKISNIIEGDGLLSNEVNQTAICGNYIWAATKGGISFFPKSYSGSFYSLPQVMINGITVGNIKYVISDTIHLNHKRNNFKIEIFCPSYRSGRNISYEYRIPELDTNWSVTANSYLEFSSMPSGHFGLEIRAINKWGQRTLSVKKLLIINDPPFWKSTWFLVLIYFCSLLLAAVLFYIISRAWQQKKEQSYRTNQKIRDLEIMALRAQMNPHFIFNCLSSIQHFILEANIVKANEYLHKFSSLIRKMFQYSNVSEISLADEIASIGLYLELEKMRLQDRMDFRIETDLDIDIQNTYIPPMIIQPYIENAVNHGVSPLRGKKGMIIVSFKEVGNYIDCSIEDNGIGINASHRNHSGENNSHTSMGNNLAVHRIEAINSLQSYKIFIKIIDKSESDINQTGTTVHLSFPIND